MRPVKKTGTYTVIKVEDRYYIEDWLYNKVAGPFKTQDDAYLCAKNCAWISVQKEHEESDLIKGMEILIEGLPNATEMPHQINRLTDMVQSVAAADRDIAQAEIKRLKLEISRLNESIRMLQDDLDNANEELTAQRKGDTYSEQVPPPS